MQTFKNPSILTKLEVWFPRYHDLYEDGKERVALLAQYKVDNATPWILVEFTKAKHLRGLRYCIKKTDAQSYKVDSNGTIPCYVIPMSKLETFDTVQDIKNTIERIGF